MGTRQHHPHHPHLLTFQLTVSILLLFVTVAGCSPSDLIRRARYIPRRIETELRHRRPHAKFVPTPMLNQDGLPTPQPVGRTQHPTPTALVQAVSQPATRGQPDVVTDRSDRGRAEPAAAPEEPDSTVARPEPTPSLPPAVVLTGVSHAWQTWNNCGPATLAMGLSFFGHSDTQADTAGVLKPDADDKNVSPSELADYARSVGLSAQWRVNGDANLLKRLLSHDLPVIVEMWIEPEPNDGMGHYRLLIGYDDAAGHFMTYDSLDGPDVVVRYAQFDAGWRVFNRAYVVVYPPEQHDVVAGLLGEAMDAETAYRGAAARAEAALEASPDDAFAWFNLGSSLSALGEHAEAAAAFDRARMAGLPWRMLWYQFGPFESYLAVGRHEDVMALADANLRNAGNLEESHYWKGRALAAVDQPDAARQAFQRALNSNPNFAPARQALVLLPDNP